MQTRGWGRGEHKTMLHLMSWFHIGLINLHLIDQIRNMQLVSLLWVKSSFSFKILKNIYTPIFLQCTKFSRYCNYSCLFMGWHDFFLSDFYYLSTFFLFSTISILVSHGKACPQSKTIDNITKCDKQQFMVIYFVQVSCGN